MAQQALFDPLPPAKPVAKNVDPWRAYEGVVLYLGDCVEVMGRIPANSVDAVVSDPPYGIGFMGREWDTFTPSTVADNERKVFQTGAGRMRNSENPNVRGRSHSPAMSPSQIEYDRGLEGQRGFQQFTERWAREALRILKPGGHAVVCGAPRSAHRMVSGLEDAGFEVRDSLAWLFGQGFPKSHNLEGGLGTALKPGHEPIALVRKPFDGTVEECVARYGTGALNIDAARIATLGAGDRDPRDGLAGETGRWPANVLLDQQTGVLLDQQTGVLTSGANPTSRGSDKFRRIFGAFKGEQTCTPARGQDRGGASRFFYVAKPSRSERDFGCDGLPAKTAGECTDRQDGSAGLTPYAGAGRSGGGRNFHPTVKPVSLMRWLVKLITPVGGVVVDPFLGSGTTGMAALLEGRTFIGMDREEEYLGIADARIGAVRRELTETRDA